MIAAPASMVPLLTIVTSFSPSSQGCAAGPLVVILPPFNTVTVRPDVGSKPAEPPLAGLVKLRVPAILKLLDSPPTTPSKVTVWVGEIPGLEPVP